MELRKKVKRPQRYEPEPLARRDPTYAPRSTRAALHMNYIDFNPTLPPATFPTLKHPTISEHSEHQTRISGSHISSPGREAATNQQLWPGWAQEVLDVPYIATDGREGKAGLRNQVPVGITHQFQRPKGDQKEQWSCEALDISDDEGERGFTVRLNAEPHWMSLPVPLQLAIVDSMVTDTTLKTVSKRLRLTPREHNGILRQRLFRGRRQCMENASIETMHTEQMHLLLHNQNHGSETITRSEFCKTFEDHLYKHIDMKEDCHTITKKDLAHAQVFLRRMGLDPDLAGEWSEIDDKYLADESQSVAVLATDGHSADTTLKLMTSSPSEDPRQPSAATEHQTMALTESSERSTTILPVKRVLFADQVRGPKSIGVAAGPTSELEFASIQGLPPSKRRKKSQDHNHEVEMKDGGVEIEQPLPR